MSQQNYLPTGLPAPQAQPDGLDTAFWEGTAEGLLRVQRCGSCKTWQWGPEWNCHACLSFDMTWEAVEPKGRIYSWERSWHPVHPALAKHGPYLIVLVELPHAGGVRMIGNLLGDPLQTVTIGDEVEAVFEKHANASQSFTLVQWRVAK